MAKKVETKVLGRKKAEKEMTLLRAIEQVVEVSRDSKLKAEAKAEMAAEVRYIAGRYGITERQAILFSICMGKGPRRVDFDDLARHLDVSNIRILSYAEDIDALVLATGFDFSGGQIENISRKATINAILHGEEANDLTRLTSFCKAERVDSEAATRRIGF